MSRKKVSELRRLNNEEEKNMSKESDEIYTDMVVYLRFSRLTELQQEQVRKDLIDMIVDGEKRGENIEEILGGSYKTVCNEIINSFPPIRRKDKILSLVYTGFLCISILLIIFAVLQFVGNLIVGKPIWNFYFKVSDAAAIVICTTVGIVAAKIIGKTISFSKKKKEGFKYKLKEFLCVYLITIIILLLIVLISLKMEFILFSCNIVFIVIAAALFYLLHLFVESKTEY